MEPPTDARKDFLSMTLCFSLSHACCTTPIIYATTFLGVHAGNIGNGVMYVTNIVCAMLLSVQLVHAISLKGSLIACLSLFSVYLGCFTLSLVVNDFNRIWLFSIVGSWFGGMAAGIGWVAQGSYFKRCAALAADAEGVAQEVVTGEMASTFAFWYLLVEVCAKVGFSLLQQTGLAPAWIGLIYFILSLVALGGITQVTPIKTDLDEAATTVLDKVLKCVSLWRSPHVWLLAALNFTFGFSAAMMNGYVNAHFAQRNLVGYLAAVTCGSAAIFAVGHRHLAKYAGKGACLAVAAASFLALSVTLLVTNKQHVWGLEVIILYLLQGSGRAVYESTNKAMFADAFASVDVEGAFANCFLQQSVASAVCFFLQAGGFNTESLYIVVLVLASAILPGYAMSVYTRKGMPEASPLVSKAA